MSSSRSSWALWSVRNWPCEPLCWGSWLWTSQPVFLFHPQPLGPSSPSWFEHLRKSPSVVVAWLVVAVPIVVVPTVWVIPLCCSILVLFLRCLWHVVHRCSAILCHVAWLATSVAHCCWILSFPLLGIPFAFPLLPLSPPFGWYHVCCFPLAFPLLYEP